MRYRCATPAERTEPPGFVTVYPMTDIDVIQAAAEWTPLDEERFVVLQTALVREDARPVAPEVARGLVALVLQGRSRLERLRYTAEQLKRENLARK